LGIMQTSAGQEEAVETLNRVISLHEALPKEQASDPNERYRLARAYQSLGEAHEQRKEPEKAVAAYEKADQIAQSLPPTPSEPVKYGALSAAIHFGSGRVKQELGQNAAARQAYDLAIKELTDLSKEDPHDALVQDLLGKALFSQGRVHEALKEPEK